MSILTQTKPNYNVEILSGAPREISPCIWLGFIEAKDVFEITKSFSDDIEKTIFFLRNNNCVISNTQEVKNFLEKHAGIIKYLFEAPNIVFKYFGQSALSLDLIFDLDVEDAEGELVLTIETNLDAKSAHKKMNKIDENWLMKIIDKDMNFFNLNLKFI
ncbi:hypothetical protein KKB43_03220 [Patescibacteria group bacterium]|nr:hypothetical protein [Patescibacteria group bacterium]MBU4580005.1 hypothetical protein [Patescibacteria group bacterium]